MAYDIYIPLIEANNPGINLQYDPIPEPATLGLLLVGGLALLRRRYLSSYLLLTMKTTCNLDTVDFDGRDLYYILRKAFYIGI